MNPSFFQKPWLARTGLLGILLLILSPQLLLLWLQRPIEHWFLHGLLPATGLCLLLLSVHRRLAVSVWLLLPLAVCAPQEWFYQLTYHKSLDAHAIAIAAETDIAEASGFLAGLTFGVIGFGVGIPLLFALTSSSARVSHWCWPRYSRWLIWLAAAAGLMWVGEQEQQYARQYPIEQKRTVEETELSRRPWPQSHNLFYQSYPINLVLAINEYRVAQQAMARIAKQAAAFRFGATQPTVVGQRQIYLLVIGETLRPDHLALNGYSRPTTPELAQVQGLVSFTDMVTPWSWTRMSVPVIISQKQPQDSRYYFDQGSIVSAMKEAGFHTSWLSTQSPLGVHDSSVALHASEADVTRYLNPVGYKRDGVDDRVLLDALQQILALGHEKQFIVLHTLGSHFSYADRYPDAFDRFLPSGKHTDLSMHDKNQRQLLVNSYDNSVLFTDHLLAQLIAQLRQQAAVSSLLFVSDHGENLFDGDCEKSGHGHNTEQDYRTAAIWWASPEFIQLYPHKQQAMQQAQHQPLMTSQVFATVLDVANVYIPHPGPETAISQGPRQRPRILANGADFDRASRLGVCRDVALPK